MILYYIVERFESLREERGGVYAVCRVLLEYGDGLDRESRINLEVQHKSFIKYYVPYGKPAHETLSKII